MIRLTLKIASPIPIDLRGVMPEAMAGMSLREVSEIPILHGNRRVELGELFEIATTTDGLVMLIGDLRSVHSIGAGMSAGVMYCRGPVGRHAGAQMTGGSLTITGDAGDWLGAENAGGSILVYGSAGSQVGAAYRGSRHGMTGGAIAIEGDAGDELGLLLRRGFIRVKGSCGAFAGASMIAGTIAVDGQLGPRAGAGMKRGTILTGSEVAPSPGFRFACEYEPQYLRLSKLMGDATKALCYRGDLTTGGRGEIWQVVR